jgi:hypothetical protein
VKQGKNVKPGSQQLCCHVGISRCLPTVGLSRALRQNISSIVNIVFVYYSARGPRRADAGAPP